MHVRARTHKYAHTICQLNTAREEYQRTKAMLDSDRNSSEKTVREIDNIQRKNSQQACVHVLERARLSS